MNKTVITNEAEVLQQTESTSPQEEAEMALEASVVLEASNESSSEILFEDTTKRSENVKHFRMRNGHYMAAVYDKPVHTFDKVTGKFVDIAHRFDEKEECFEAETDRFKARFPKKEGKRKFVTVEKDGRSVSWRYIPTTNSHKKHAVAAIRQHERASLMELPRFPQLKYEKTEGQIDLEYGITDQGVKENIVLAKRPKHSTFRFELKLDGLRAVLAENKKSIRLFAEDMETDEPEFIIPSINMTDAAGVYSEAAHYELVEDENGTVMKIVIDPEWLLAEERLYPVIVDPQIYIPPTETANPWTMVNVKIGSSLDEVDQGLRRIGYDSSGVENRLYMKIRLSEPPEGYKITDATLKLAQNSYKSSGCPIYFDVLGVSEWNKDAISKDNLPDICGTALDTFKGQTRGSREFIKLNITSQVKEWYKNGETNGHLVIKVNTSKSTADDCNSASYIDIYSDENTDVYCPMIYFTYTSVDAYADHQKYESFEMGRAGTGSVNLFNGSLTFTHSDVSVEGKRLPLSIAHIYRTEYSEEPASGDTYGHGWVLSAAQKLTRENRNDVKAVYRDAQGRRHFLVKNRDGTVTDDAGLGLFYEDCCNTSNGCCSRLFDEKGNEMCFDASGNMTCMKDSRGNVCKYIYSGNQLISVVDGSGRTATLEYDGDLLSKIIDHKGRIYEYHYTATDKLLSRVIYPDGDETVFTYDTNNKLDSVTDPTGVTHRISYNDRKVETVCQLGANGECGASTRFDYYARSTAVTDTITKLKMVYRMDASGRVQSSYEDLIKTSLAKGSMTATTLENYQTIVNTHNDDGTNYTGKYRSLSASVPGTDDQFPNLIKNGNFKTAPNSTTDWNCIGTISSDGVKEETYLRGYQSYYMFNPSATKYIKQTVSLDSANIHGNVLVASAWAKASGQVADTSENAYSTAKFELRVKVIFKDNTDAEYIERFDSLCNEWQYVAAPIAFIPNNPPKSATITLDYSYNNGSCYFTNVRLFTVKGNTSIVEYEEKDQTIDGVTDKIRKTITKYDGRIKTIEYENKRSDVVMSEIIDTDGNSFKSYYSYNTNHTLRKSKDYRGLVTEYTYDAYGNETQKKTYITGDLNHYMIEKTEYDDNGVFVKKAYDPRSNELYTKYNYEGDLLKSKVEQNDQTYDYTYNSVTDEMTSVSSAVGNAKPINQFAYTHGNMTSVTHNGYQYKFTYDGLNRTASITAGGSPLVNLAYTVAAISTVKSTYGNGYETIVTSDSRGNPIRKTVNGTVVSVAEYDEVGNPVRLVDSLKKVCYTYTYDSDGNVTSVTETPDEGIARINETKYDADSGRATEKIYDAVNHTYKTIYETNEDDHIYPDNTAVGMTLVGRYTDQTERDGFGRVTARHLKLAGKSKAIIGDSYAYLQNEFSSGACRETNFVDYVTQTTGEDQCVFQYTYDNNGNIVRIEKNTCNNRKYTYDGLNRLTAEDNFDVMRRYEWSYDDGGNIIEKCVYVLNATGTKGTLISTIPYGYDTEWKDKLISYNGNTGFAYDNLGNPTKYKGIDLTWTNVRRLASYGDNTFEYGADGIRFKKNNTTYVLDGNRILRETDGTKTLTYYYGTNGVIGFRYNDADYFYHKNLQGDVLAIYDTNGVKQAEYEYDAWGKVLNVIHNDCCCSDIGNINPFRYRSYYYDVETGLYYLQTRYYDPEVGRFINSDALEYLGDGAELSNYNLFAYCGNNPVMGYDPEGTFFWHIVAGAVIGAAVGAVSCIISEAMSGEGIDWKKVAVSATAGAVTGTLAAIGIPPVWGTVANVAVSAAESIGHDLVDSEDQTVVETLLGAAESAAFSYFCSWLGGPSNGKEMIALHKESSLAKKTLKNAKNLAKKAVKDLRKTAKKYTKTVISNLSDDITDAICEIIGNATHDLLLGVFEQ